MRVVVIGAGVLGASTAYHLARNDVNVTVVDRAHDGRATAAGAGIICPWASATEDAAFYRLYSGGGAYYASLVEALAACGEFDLGFRRSGALLVSDQPGELAFLEELLRRRSRQTPEMGRIEAVGSREIQRLFPPLRAGLAGIHVSGGARVDGRRLAAALLRAAQRLGATIRSGEATLQSSGDRVTGIRLNGEAIAADQVVVAAGAWAPALLHPLGLRLPVEPQRGQIMHLRLPDGATETWPVILPPGSHYLVPFDGGRIVVGATRETGSGFDYRVTAAGQHEVLGEALRIAPGLGVASVLETRVGFRPTSPDMRPLLGYAGEVDGLVIGNGLGAAGLTIGPFAGSLLADLVLARPLACDLAPFDPSRRHVSGGSQVPLR